ncbi:MAG: DUF3943 domain-containing protein [Thermoanaerobaculia bacterium]
MDLRDGGRSRWLPCLPLLLLILAMTTVPAKGQCVDERMAQTPGRSSDAREVPFSEDNGGDVRLFGFRPTGEQAIPSATEEGVFPLFRGDPLLPADADDSGSGSESEKAEDSSGSLSERPRGLRNQDAPFMKKFRRGERIIFGTELVSLGILLLSPQLVTQWSDDPLSNAAENLKRAWTLPPVWDNDGWYHNYVGHPYAGSIYYNMLRSQGATQMQSFLFSTLQCVLFEYVIEAVAERPSIQDLIFTSTLGSVLGEVFHRWALKMVQKDLTFLQKVLVLFADPSYVLNNGFRAR